MWCGDWVLSPNPHGCGDGETCGRILGPAARGQTSCWLSVPVSERPVCTFCIPAYLCTRMLILMMCMQNVHTPACVPVCLACSVAHPVPRPVHVIVATPGRILDLINKRLVNMDSCNMLVLDEVCTSSLPNPRVMRSIKSWE